MFRLVIHTCLLICSLVFTYFPTLCISPSYPQLYLAIGTYLSSLLFCASLLLRDSLWSSVVFCCFLHLHESTFPYSGHTKALPSNELRKTLTFNTMFGAVDTQSKLLLFKFHFEPAPSHVQSRQCSSSQNTRSDQSTPWIQSDAPLRELR